MRTLTLMISITAGLAAQASATSPVLDLNNPAYADPAKKWESLKDALATNPEISANLAACRDTINKARAQLGKPPLLDRELASPDKPHHIYAVDRREGDCSVMVMKGDPNDIRPLPDPMEGPLKIPAEANGK